MGLTTGGKILAYRRSAQLTQDELAAKAEVSQTYLSELENDKRPAPSVNVLGRIAAALGITLNDLVETP